jgi:hypothetical protein
LPSSTDMTSPFQSQLSIRKETLSLASSQPVAYLAIPPYHEEPKPTAKKHSMDHLERS